MKKILVVDDDPDILDVVSTLLKNHHHFDVQTTTKWKNVFDLTSTYKPDLILLDITLGGADGREICRQLKDSTLSKNIPVILFSANYNMGGNLKGCRADAFIQKPFEFSNLVDTIKLHLIEPSLIR